MAVTGRLRLHVPQTSAPASLWPLSSSFSLQWEMEKEEGGRNWLQRQKGKKKMPTEWELTEGGKKWKTFKGRYYSTGFTKGIFQHMLAENADFVACQSMQFPRLCFHWTQFLFLWSLHLQWHCFWFGACHPFVTFLSWHHAYRQVFMPVNLLCFPRVTLWISTRKNTKSPICFFITQRINTKWGSLLSCHTGKPPHYSAPNKHLLRVNKSSVWLWLSLCREWLTIHGNLSLRKKK